MSAARDMLEPGSASDAVCDWCGEDAPSLVDAEAVFGGPECGHICPLCVERESDERERDEVRGNGPAALSVIEGWK